jgi:branched-chain amino acid transport system substrate-binding protein
VQGSYEGAATQALRLMQVDGMGSLIQAASYDGECVNCPDIWVRETADEDADGSQTFTVGLIAALDGAAEAQGENIEAAVRLAIREINAAGGVLSENNTRYTLNLQTYSAQTADEADAALTQAAEDGVSVVLGPDYNAQVLPNLTSAETAGVTQLVSATSVQIAQGESEDYLMQLRATDETLVQAAAAYLIDVRGFTRFATVASRTDYGLDSIDSFESAVAGEEGVDVVLQLEHEIDEADYDDMAAQIAASSAQAVVIWSSQPAAAELLTALTTLDWSGIVLYGYLTPDFVEGLEISSTIELMGVSSWWSSGEDWASRDFTSRYLDRYGEEPLPQSAAYYDAVYLIARVLEESSSSVDISAIAALESFVGVQGQYSPDEYGSGELTRMSMIVLWDGEQVQPLARYDNNSCVAGCQ